MPPAHRSVLALLAACGLAGAGCTTSGSTGVAVGDFTGEQKDIAQVVDDLSGVTSADDVCDQLLAKGFADKIAAAGGTGGRCADRIEDSLGDVTDTAIEIPKGGIRITGTTATARVVSGGDDDPQTDTLGFTKEGGAWKLSSVGE